MAYRDPVEVGAAVAQLRKQAGLGQGEIAQRLGVDQPAMSRIERGLRNLSAWELYILADLFQIDPDTILRKDEPQEALLRAGGVGSQAIRQGMESFEDLAREVLAARALAELL